MKARERFFNMEMTTEEAIPVLSSYISRKAQAMRMQSMLDRHEDDIEAAQPFLNTDQRKQALADAARASRVAQGLVDPQIGTDPSQQAR